LARVTDGPHRYFDTVYNDEFCRANDLLGHPPAADPDQIDDPGRAGRGPVDSPRHVVTNGHIKGMFAHKRQKRPAQ
jgi:hypothetical protein